MSKKRPIIAVTMGDPAGVGPEIIAGVWTETLVHDWCLPVVIGNPEVLRRAVSLWQNDVAVVQVASPADAQPSPGVIPCVACGSDDAARVEPGMIDPRGGQAAYDALLAAAEFAKRGEVQAITTSPLHKEALHRAGHHYPGHTELLAELCGVNDYAMMLYLGPDETLGSSAGLAVVHVTLHTAMRTIFDQITVESILAKIRLADRFMSRLKGSQPRVAVCALNPHAGEGGLFGQEESTIIAPAVERAKKDGLDVTGPLPTDTLMVQARDGRFDAVVAMYHDQGHIALKLLDMHRAVNVTLGLPIVRTSVAHGTAFDIAWQRRAETSGMVEALRVASRLCR